MSDSELEDDFGDEEVSEGMTADEVSAWLERKGIPTSFCSILNENYIDGKEFLKLSMKDIRDMIPAVGIAKKIARLVPQLAAAELQSAPALSAQTKSAPDNLPSTSINIPPSCSASGSGDLSSSASPSISLASSSRSGQLSSDSFNIPTHWRPETESCIQKKVLTKECRSDIVRTLVTLTVAKVGSRPTRSHCQQVARKLILQYPFMKDDMGDGYTSWVDKMLERVRNLIKADRKKSKGSPDERPSACKRSKGTVDNLVRRYPVKTYQTDGLEDKETIDQHFAAIAEEMKKARPRERVLLPLMKTTFPSRWLFVTKDASSVKQILEKYPCLKLPAIIEQEMSLIVDRPDVKSSFVREWTKFVPAIIAYGEKSTKKAIQDLIHSLTDEDEEHREAVALQILCESLTPKTSKDAIKFIYAEYQVVTPVEDAKSEIPSPRIGAYVHDDTKQFFIFVEGEVVCEVTSLSQAIFLMFSSFYAFYLEYPKPVKNVLFFLQDYIFSYPDSFSRNASYLAVASDIKSNL